MLHRSHEGNMIVARGCVCVCKIEIEGDALVCANLFQTSGKAAPQSQAKCR